MQHERRRIMMSAVAGALAVAAACGAEVIFVCTTFPLRIFTMNVTQGCAGTRVEQLVPSSAGCPHRYSLTPRDMRKIAGARVLIVNGLGLEEFLAIEEIKKVNPGITIVDSAAGLQDLLEYRGGQADEPHTHHHADDHGENAVNPHLFASPRRAAKQALNIAAGLAHADPERAETYLENGRKYAARLDALADEMRALGTRLKVRRVLHPEGIFNYLVCDMGLELIGGHLPHGHEPSAGEMAELIATARAEGAGAILLDVSTPPRFGEMLARELGLPKVVLDSVAAGPNDAQPDYYERVMRTNMQTLHNVFGLKE